jgi:hypothetical protein
MQRLQDLVLELNQEIAAVDDGGIDSPRIVELRRRIAELTRGGAESVSGVSGKIQSDINEMGGARPPSYQSSLA